MKCHPGKKAADFTSNILKYKVCDAGAKISFFFFCNSIHPICLQGPNQAPVFPASFPTFLFCFVLVFFSQKLTAWISYSQRLMALAMVLFKVEFDYTMSYRMK